MFQEGQILGDFEILGRIGQGAMGAVYKARQVSLKRVVALKTLQGAIAADPEYIARFHREAIAAAGLNHPNLVQVYAAGETDGLHWFAMEYVEGESAQGRLKRKGRLDPAVAIAIGIHAATALDYAWRKAQLIHRDIKPDNIFLSGDGEVKLGDLGLAKSAGEDQSLTTTGAAMGTPHYVSPEQGEGKKDVDLRADIYSLGCTLFHFIAGETPYKGDTAMGVMLRHVTAPVPELRTVWPQCPAELSRVVMKMMQKSPAERQQSHEEVIADLRGAYDAFKSGSVPALLTVSRQSLPSTGKRLPFAALAIGLVLVAATAALLHFAPWKNGVQVIVPPVASSEGWTNLIAGADVKRDSLQSPWRVESGALCSPHRDAEEEDAPGSHNTFVFPVPNLPRNYDLRYRITRNARGHAVAIGFSRGDESGDLRIDGGNGFRIFSPRMGKEKGMQLFLGVGETHYVLLEVREDRVRGSLDGKVMTEKIGKLPSGQRDTAFFPSSKITGAVVAIGVCGGSITVHSAEFRETDKDGKPVTVTTAPAPPARVAVTPAATPTATPAPAAATPTPAVAATMLKVDPAKESSYVGKWSAKFDGGTYLINEDYTAVSLQGKNGSDVKGTWELTPKGVFKVSIEDRPNAGPGRHFRLSEDGKTLHGTTMNSRWDRWIPPQAVSPAPPAATPTPAAVKAEPAKPAAYVGTWATRVGRRIFILKDDHTAIKTESDGQNTNGTWELADGGIRVKWTEGGVFNGKLSADGQNISSDSGLQWIRKTP